MQHVLPQHRPFVELCAAMYSSIPSNAPQGYTLLKTFNETKGTMPRIGLYDDGTKMIVVFRGSKDTLDTVDDVRLTRGEETSLEQEGDMMFKEITKPCIAVGHSLGGYAAMKFAQKHALNCVIFNPAASPLRPVFNGPGNQSLCYHIVGDLVSSHISDKAISVVRIDLGLGFGSTIYNHVLQRFRENKPSRIISSGEEDYLFAQFKQGFRVSGAILGFLSGGASNAALGISAAFITRNFGTSIFHLPRIPDAQKFSGKESTSFRQTRSGAVVLGVANKGKARKIEAKSKRRLHNRGAYKEGFLFRS